MKFPSFHAFPSDDSSDWEMSGPSSSDRPLFAVYKAELSPRRSLAQKAMAWKSLEFWKKIPSLLNLLPYSKLLNPEADGLAYDPIHLHVSMQQGQPLGQLGQRLTPKTTTEASLKAPPGAFTKIPGQAEDVSSPPASPLPEALQGLRQSVSENSSSRHTLTADNFRFMLEQVPAIRTLSFSGPPDPLLNQNLMQMVAIAYKFNYAETTIFTDGLALGDWIDEILDSPLASLVVKLEGHKPSEYWRLTGRPPQEFVRAQDALQKLLLSRLGREKNNGLTVDIILTIDFHNYRAIPEMLGYAETMGVDGVRFENYVPPLGQPPSDLTLYSHQANVVQYLQLVQNELVASSPLHVVMPVLLDEDMSNHHNCREAYTTVTVDADFTIAGCPRHIPTPEEPGKIWDPDFWNSDLYRWVRGVHSPTGSEDHTGVAPPSICQSCPMNMPRPRRRS